MHDIKGLRAVSLLRVSTINQATKDEQDIPAQRDLVRKFVDETKEFIQEMINKKLSNDFYKKLKNNIESSSSLKKIRTKELEEKQKQIITLKKEIPNAMINKGVFSVIELKEAIELIQANVEGLLVNLHEIDSTINQAKTVLADYTNLEDSLSNWESRYSDVDLFGKKAMIKQIINKVIVKKDGIEIDYRMEVKLFSMNSSVMHVVRDHEAASSNLVTPTK